MLYNDRKLTQKRNIAESARFFEAIVETPAKEPEPHPGWSRSRRIMERLGRDRFKGSYGWDKGDEKSSPDYS